MVCGEIYWTVGVDITTSQRSFVKPVSLGSLHSRNLLAAMLLNFLPWVSPTAMKWSASPNAQYYCCIIGFPSNLKKKNGTLGEKDYRYGLRVISVTGL